MEEIIIVFIIFGFLIFLCVGFYYMVTYDDRQKYKIKKLEAVKKDELYELKSQILSIKLTVEKNRQNLEYIKSYIRGHEYKQENKQSI